MRNWLISILIALVLSTAASAEKFTLEVVGINEDSVSLLREQSCYRGYSLQVSGVPEGTKYIEFDLAWQCGDPVASFEAAIESDGVLNLDDHPIVRGKIACDYNQFQWTARAKSKSGWVPKSLGIARVSFDKPPIFDVERRCPSKHPKNNK